MTNNADFVRPEVYRLYLAMAMTIYSRVAGKNPSCAIWFCGYVGSMKWQQFLTLVSIVVAVVILVWRSSGRKSGHCGCKCGCAHEPDTGSKKEDAGR